MEIFCDNIHNRSNGWSQFFPPVFFFKEINICIQQVCFKLLKKKW